MRKLQSVVGLLTAVLLFISAAPVGAQTTPVTETAQPSWAEILADPLDVLRLANRENLLDKAYPPEDEAHKLIKATVSKSKNDEMKIRETISEPLAAMFEAAKEDGAKLLLHSAYRSYQTQSTMYKNRLARIGYDDGYVQLPGASDHQTGLGVDIVNAVWAKKSGFNSEFAKTTEGQWMAQNCWKFGFIIRYPEGKKDITGVPYEPWHLRYVGVEAATYITEHGLTLEEFCAQMDDLINASTSDPTMDSHAADDSQATDQTDKPADDTTSTQLETFVF